MSSESLDDLVVQNTDQPSTLEGSDAELQAKNCSELSEDRVQELDKSYRILMDIIRQNKTTCWPFMDEVDIKGLGLWDYETKVKEPMWLNKIIDKFEKGQYLGITEFARDFRTMVENCYRYNGTDHLISKKAKRLEMALEGKLALLKKDIRDKASLSVTSNGKFSIEMNNDGLVPVSRYGRIGNSREYATVLDDTSAKLVYDFIRCEETMLVDDEKKASYRERRQQEMLYQKIAAAWIATVEENSDMKYIKTCHALPELGFFLHLSEAALKFPELSMYQLERCLLIPEHSLYLARIMTSLLCSYQERSQIGQRPPMHFNTWNKRVKERLTKWFELVQKYNCYTRASRKLGISLEFFEALEWKNPFVANPKDKFSELEYKQKVQILKALCDSLVSLQSIQNAFCTMDASQLQCMQLGKDYLGNVYVYFPQFCGDDVRVYRHREFGEPSSITVPDEIWTPPKLLSGTVLRSEQDRQNLFAGDETESDKKQLLHGKENGISGEETKSETTEELKSDLNLSVNSKSVGSVVKEDKCISSSTINSESVKCASDVDRGPMVVSKDGIDLLQSGDASAVGKRSSRIRKQTKRYTDASASRVKNSKKRDHSGDEGEVSDSSTPKKRKQSNATKGRISRKDLGQSKNQPVKYGNIDFEMLCDSIDALQLLISELESKQTQEIKSLHGRKAYENQQELIEKVRWLYDELEPWNMKLQRARLSTQVQMKKEHNEIENLLKKVDPWTEEFSGKNSFLYGDNLTIAHTDSPMSSVASFDGDDEEYVHPYFTRKVNTPELEKCFDEALYETERESLLPAALLELENVLKSNLKELLKLADRAQLEESNPANDRRTRRKIKHQNKVLGKIITFAEQKRVTFPSLLPILMPNEDVFEVVDMVFLKEETRVQELADEQRRKRVERSVRRQNSRKSKKKHQEKAVLEKVVPSVPPIPRFQSKYIPETENLTIRMQNGQIYPATRLSNGSVVPIMRPKNSSIASSVTELVENTHKEVCRNTVDTTPTISLRCGSPRNHTQPQEITLSSPTRSKPAVTQTLTEPAQNAPGISQMSSTGLNQINPVTVTQLVRTANASRPIIINGARYAFVPKASSVALGQLPSSETSANSQPITLLRPFLPPLQIITSAIKCQPQNNGVVFVPVQNCATTSVAPVRIGTTPFLQVLTSPQKQQQNKP